MPPIKYSDEIVVGNWACLYAQHPPDQKVNSVIISPLATDNGWLTFDAIRSVTDKSVIISPSCGQERRVGLPLPERLTW